MANIEDIGMNPYEASLALSKNQVEMQGLLDTIRLESEKMVDAASSKQQFIPGTGGETLSTLLQKKQGDLQAQLHTQKVAAAADWENLSVMLAQDISQLTNQARQVTSKIAQDSSVSLFDDPLGAIANAFTLPWDQQKLEGITQKLEVTQKTANAAHQHIQQSAVTADKIATKLTQQGLADIATAGEAMQVQTAAKARLEALQSNAKGVEMVMNMDNRQLDLYLKARQARQQDEQMALSRAREARQMQILDMQYSKIKESEEGEKLALKLANAAIVAEGKNPMDEINLKMLKGNSEKYFQSLVQKGMELAINGTEGYTHGKTMADRAQWQKTIGWKPETPQQEAIILMQNSAWNSAKTAAGKPDPQNAELAFVKSFREGQKDVREGSAFQAPSWVVLGKTNIVKNPVWQKYVVPQLNESNGYNPVDPNIISNALVDAVLAKEISSSQAAAFGAAIFQSAVHINNEVQRFSKITGGLEQTEYGARIKIDSFDKTKPMNLVDQAQWNMILSSKIASKFGVRPWAAGPAVRDLIGVQ